jgi:hypothetical protein
VPPVSLERPEGVETNRAGRERKILRGVETGLQAGGAAWLKNLTGSDRAGLATCRRRNGCIDGRAPEPSALPAVTELAPAALPLLTKR